MHHIKFVMPAIIKLCASAVCIIDENYRIW